MACQYEHKMSIFGINHHWLLKHIQVYVLWITKAVNNAWEAASVIILLKVPTLLFIILLLLLPVVPRLAAGLALHQTLHLLPETDHHHKRREIWHFRFLVSLFSLDWDFYNQTKLSVSVGKSFQPRSGRCASLRHTIGDGLPSCMRKPKARGHSRSFSIFPEQLLQPPFAENVCSPFQTLAHPSKTSRDPLKSLAANATAQEGRMFGENQLWGVWSKQPDPQLTNYVETNSPRPWHSHCCQKMLRNAIITSAVVWLIFWGGRVVWKAGKQSLPISLANIAAGCSNRCHGQPLVSAQASKEYHTNCLLKL